MGKLGFHHEVTLQEIVREKSLGEAINLCAKVAGLAPKQVQDALGADKAQFSRWIADKEGILWPKLIAFMDTCGNDAPLLWMLHARGYDLASLRRQETEVERELRLAKEEIAMLRHDKRVLTEAVRGAILWEEPAPMQRPLLEAR